jgi:hypothetical protein
MPTSPDGHNPKRRSWQRWPPEVLEILRQNKNPVAICEELASLTGKNTRACWTFMTRHGIKRPGSAKRHKFDHQKTDELIEYISDHGVHAAAQRFRYDTKSLYNLLYRQEYTKLSKDTITLRQLSMHLRMRFCRLREWVEQGLLKAKRYEFKSGSVSYRVSLDEIREFCKKHKDLIITRRTCLNRMRFLEEVIFAPKHADIVDARNSKHERQAFERGEYLKNTRRSQKSA